MKQLLLFMIFTTYLIAGCSEYIDHITINEVYKPKDKDEKSFIEISSVDGTKIHNDWTIVITNVKKNGWMGNKTTTTITELNVTEDGEIPDCNETDYYTVTEVVDDDLLDFKNDLIISLLDTNRDYIDHFTIIGDEDEYPTECDDNYSYDIYLDDDGNLGSWMSSDVDIYRDADRIGDWYAAKKSVIFGNDVNVTECESNDETSPESVTYKFDTWDTFRDIDDRNISTVISAKEFNLTLASLNETNDGFQEFNGTVCSIVVKNGDSSDTKSGWVKSLFEDDNTTTVSFNTQKSLKDSKIYMEWKENVNEDCPLTEDNSTTSTDNFAIRPDRFSFTTTTALPYYAGEIFKIKAHAYDDDGDDTQDYNETIDSSFSIDGNETRVECIIGDETLDIAEESFGDGVTPDINITFSGIANFLNIEIHEINGSEFASVDIDDTSDDSMRLITPFDMNLTVMPYEINVTTTDINASSGNDWLYMANFSDMNISFNTIVKVNNKNHELQRDFNSTCYAQDVNITFGVVSDGNSSLDMNYRAITGSFSDGTTDKNETLADINQSMTIRANSFIDGTGSAKMVFNVAREYFNPINPFKINGLDSNITTVGIAKEINNDASDSNISLYYGRIRAKDIRTTLNADINHTIEIEVYDKNSTSYTNGFKHNSLAWYRNANHNSITDGNVTAIDATKRTTLKSVEFSLSTIYSPSNGIIKALIPHNEGSYIMHIKTQPWLWYIDRNFGDDYNDSAMSKCIEHPCFNYTLEQNSNSNISSGSYSGGRIKIKSRGDYVKTGLKVYR